MVGSTGRILVQKDNISQLQNLTVPKHLFNSCDGVYVYACDVPRLSPLR